MNLRLAAGIDANQKTEPRREKTVDFEQSPQKKKPFRRETANQPDPGNRTPKRKPKRNLKENPGKNAF